MGFEIQNIRLPKQLQEEIKSAAPHLKIILPAAAAVFWFAKRVFWPRHDKASGVVGDDLAPCSCEEGEDEGEAIEIEFPAKPRSLSTRLPFVTPRPLKITLMSATFPLSIDALWRHIMSGGSEELAEFHRTGLGELNVALSPWRRRQGGGRCRVLRFTTPLKNPLGPREAKNCEVFTLQHLSHDAWVVTTQCKSQGVPFASSFANHVQWVAIAAGPETTELTVTGECRFITPVWGPLKGTIARESSKGMSKAYKILLASLSERFGVMGASYQTTSQEDSAPQSGTMTPLNAIRPAADGFLAVLNSPQASPAVMVVMIAVFVLMWRMALLNSIALQAFHRIATSIHRNG